MSQPVLADTHTLIWYVDGDDRLSTRARDALDAATAADQPILVSPITLLEAKYLEDSGKVAPDTVVRLTALFADPNSAFEAQPIDLGVIAAAIEPPWRAGDPADRILAGTAKALGVVLVTRDRELTGTAYVETLW